MSVERALHGFAHHAKFLIYSVSLAKLIVEPFTLPEEVEAMMDKRTSVGMMAPVMGA